MRAHNTVLAVVIATLCCCATAVTPPIADEQMLHATLYFAGRSLLAAWKRGDITWYEGVRVMCGQKVNRNKGNYAAISYKLADKLNTNTEWPPSWCGRKARIVGKKGSATVRVIDYCGSCNGAGDIDVSKEIFQKVVGDLKIGRTTVKWHFIH